MRVAKSHGGEELYDRSADTPTRFVGVIAFALDRDQAAVSVSTEDIDAAIIRSTNDLDTLRTLELSANQQRCVRKRMEFSTDSEHQAV